VVVAGDQQSFGNMVRILVAEPSKYAWCTPVPGDWHALVHMLIQIDRDFGKDSSGNMTGIAKFADSPSFP